MAKESMIQREKKRERLIAKYASKRESIKEDLKNVGLDQKSQKIVQKKKLQ